MAAFSNSWRRLAGDQAVSFHPLRDNLWQICKCIKKRTVDRPAFVAFDVNTYITSNLTLNRAAINPDQ